LNLNLLLVSETNLICDSHPTDNTEVKTMAKRTHQKIIEQGV